MELPFVTLDVFATERYKGNQLAVVTIPRTAGPALTQAQKQAIAREFNLSETVIVHEKDAPDPATRRIDIFLTDAEIPFAGHPTIGAAVSLLPQGVTTLITKAGPIAVTQPRPGVVQAGIPHSTHLHTRTLADLAPGDPATAAFSTSDAIRSAERAAPLFSIVKGMTFALIELPSLEALGDVQLIPATFPVDQLLDDGWKEGIIGRYYYVRTGQDGGTVKIRSRMVLAAIEDAATGSAACSLSSYLTLAGASERDRTVNFEITQGVEMGRESNIYVEVVAKDGKVDKVSLAGAAVQVMRGHISV